MEHYYFAYFTIAVAAFNLQTAIASQPQNPQQTEYTLPTIVINYKHFNNNTIKIEDSYNSLFEDPCEGKKKILIIDYTDTNNHDKKITFIEDNTILLNDVKKINKCSYRKKPEEKNVTDIVATNHLNDGKLLINVRYNDIFGDICKKIGKELLIDYVETSNKILSVTFSENEKIELDNIKQIIKCVYKERC